VYRQPPAPRQGLALPTGYTRVHAWKILAGMDAATSGQDAYPCTLAAPSCATNRFSGFLATTFVWSSEAT